MTVPSDVEETGDTETGEDLSILEQSEWDGRVSSKLHLPKDKQRENDDDTDDDGCNGRALFPLALHGSIEGGRDEDTDESTGNEDDTDEIELPKDVRPQSGFEDRSDG